MAVAGRRTTFARIDSRRLGGQPHGDGSFQSRDEPSFTLVRPLGTTTWLASLDGGFVAARPAPRSAHLKLAGLPSGGHLVELEGTSTVDGVPWLVSRYVRGMALDRLLNVATLTPFQAAAVAIDIYQGLAELHTADRVHGRLSAETVLVGDDGAAWLSDWAVASLADSTADSSGGINDGPPDGVKPAVAGPSRDADLRAAGSVVAQLAREADRPVTRRRNRDARVLTELARVASSEPPRTAAATARDLRSVVTTNTSLAAAHADVRVELARLITVVIRRAQAAAPVVPPPQPAGAPPPPRSAFTSARRLSRADWRTRRRRRRVGWTLVIALLVLAAVGVLARGQITSTVHKILHHGATAAGPTTSALPAGGRQRHAAGQPQAVPVLAPAAAGVVSHVRLRPFGHCVPGRQCTVRMTTRLVPSTSARRLAWQLVVVDRCTGHRTLRRGGTMTVRPGWTSVSATRTLRLPAAPALATVALSTSPARAASAPMLIPLHAHHC
ncbi:MAG TPA: protein kinase [Jatrophihabitans sp.]|nr:protein kinase [Jatrophihabitans sp.]